MSICLDPFKNISIEFRQNIKDVAPCCLIRGTPVEDINFYKNETLIEYREQWLRGSVPDKCEVCIKSEHQLGNSRRLGTQRRYRDWGKDNTDIELLSMDYWVGDTCNLKCIICGPHSSSQWKEELNIPLAEKKSVVNQNWKELDLSSLRTIHFNGGEPLLSKEHVKLLDEVPNKGQVRVNYNTNATILPTAELLKLWEQFELVQLDFSIDDLGDRFEYQRYPAKWQSVTENLQWFIDNCPVNCMFAVNTTVSILNYANLDNLSMWLQQNFSSNRVTDPIEHRRQMAHGIFSLANADKNPEKYKEFLDKCDSIRGTNWRKTFPELN